MRESGTARVGAVIVAGGSGRRIGGPAKQFRDVGGRPLLAWSCARFGRHPAVGPVVVVLPSDAASDPPDWLAAWDVRVAEGGAERRDSVRAGLAALGGGLDAVLVHDAARPFVSSDLLDRLVAAVARGPAVPVVPLADTIKRMRSRSGDPADVIEGTVDRDRLRAVQTPQAFPLALIRRLHERAEEEGAAASDDAILCERAGVDVAAVEGERWAFKITHREDLALADWLVASGRVRWPEEEG